MSHVKLKHDGNL